MFKAIKNIFIFSIILFAAFLLLLPLWVQVWHTNVWTIIIISFSLVVAFILPVVWGVLQGTNRFGQLGINNSVEMVAKLAVAIILVLAGTGIYGVLVAIPLSLIVAFFAGLIPLKDIIRVKAKSFSFEKTIMRYSLSAFIIFFLFISLYSIDIIMARYFFSPIDAGLYSAISVIGKVVLFGSAGLTRAMFSEVTEKHEKQKTERSRKESRKILFRALGFLATISGIILFLSFIFPEVIINLVVGNKYIAATPLLKYMVLAMTFLSFSSLIIFYNLSIDWHKKTTARILSAALFLQIAFLILFHGSVEQFVKVILGANIGLFLALLITIKR
ncbi:MAG: hypothetical protein K6T16_01255 [Candidatus Pacearchaeota archaeon]|nr:hypothetical protein [Candidatus Pacearchaeota archaeon]